MRACARPASPEAAPEHGAFVSFASFASFVFFVVKRSAGPFPTAAGEATPPRRPLIR